MELNLEEYLPKTVYKYRDFDEDTHRRIITEQEIYFARPSEFPDPYDCRYRIDREYIRDEHNRRIYYANEIGTDNLNHPQINKWIEEITITDESIDFQEQKTQKVLNKLYGIFSVSRTYRNEHLWKIFGANHKGFCVGINFMGILPLNEGTKGKVKYKEIDQLPKSKVVNFDNDEEFIKYVMDSILTLPIDFVEEQEYRIQKLFKNDSERYIKLDKKHIESIIIGHKMSATKRTNLIEITNKFLPEVKIKRLKYSNGRIIEIDLE